MLTLLHTSDWHLGRRLYGKPRYEEFSQFLEWQLTVVREHAVDVLVIAGDIFDTSTPSNQAQSLYYHFLHEISQTTCQHVVIVAGNHDSPNFLDAPKQLLKGFNIHIIGSIGDNVADELIVLNDANGAPSMLVAAVPYLRDRDVRSVSSGEHIDDKENKLISGIQAHYANITTLAKAKQAELEQTWHKKIPLIATGHLFAAGGQTVEGDGVRELYVGSLAQVRGQMFDTGFDYVALGHLHVPQAVGGYAHIRYSGSPIAMGFGEATQQKQVHLVRFFADDQLLTQPIYDLVRQRSDATIGRTTNSKPPKKTTDTVVSLDLFTEMPETIPPMGGHLDISSTPYTIAKLSDTTLLQSLAVPTFQPLESIKGDWPTIKTRLQALKQTGQSVWLEIVYDGVTIIGDLAAQIAEITNDSPLTVLRIKNQQLRNQTLQAQHSSETLDELDELQVFERCMTTNQIPDAQQATLKRRYLEVLEVLHP